MIPSLFGLVVMAVGLGMVYLGLHGAPFLEVSQQTPLIPTGSGTGGPPAQ